ncbi:MAG: Cof-type HAD-IIB family hydrolase [Lachnospiraceae bacterium]|nr:Cof-type HAD-IIB family hydrolase [Lachnospiraceae bacterium]
MIKLIACDLDGTLLDSNKRLPEEFPKLIEKLKAKGIHFAVASGRSYAGIKEMFIDYIDDIVFICDNGAFVMYKEERLHLDLMKKEDIRELALLSRDLDGLILLCGMHGTYHMPAKTKEANDEIVKYYTNRVLVEDDLDVDDEFFKVALFDGEGSEEHSYPYLVEKYGDKYNGQTSGKYWMDIMNGGTNKGSALKAIQEKFDISYDETMAFGDYMNDYELLENASYSFAMANSHPKISKLANYKAGSNDENGVLKAIVEYVFDGDF